MSERLTFYTKRDSFIHRLNPLTKLTFVFGFILISFLSPWYWTPQFLILLVIFPLSFVGRVYREYFTALIRLILPAIAFLFFMQALFQPGGVHEVLRIWVLVVTQESLYFAFGNASRIFLMVSSFTLILLTTHPSELMSDLTRRGLPGQFAYVIVSTVQIIPQMQSKAQTIIAAQRSRGLETEGSLARRVGALFPLVAPLVFGSLVDVEERAIAIEARGFTSTRQKTFLYEIPDTSFDKIARWVMVALVFLTLLAKLWR